MLAIKGGRRILSPAVAFFGLLAASTVQSQVDQNQLGAWYSYSLNKAHDNSRWGTHVDWSYRTFELVDDFRQFILRGGAIYRPEFGNAVWTFGAAHSTNGELGEGNSKVRESRLYQEAVVSRRPAPRVFLRHRFRFEQRWIDGQSFRTRFRYGLYTDVPLNRQDLRMGAFYLSFYGELLLNGEHNIGGGRRVDTFDSGRIYGGIGYSFSNTLRLQAGYMHLFLDETQKRQLLINLNHSF